jgi:hypothetical protein
VGETFNERILTCLDGHTAEKEVIATKRFLSTQFGNRRSHLSRHLYMF